MKAALLTKNDHSEELTQRHTNPRPERCSYLNIPKEKAEGLEKNRNLKTGFH